MCTCCLLSLSWWLYQRKTFALGLVQQEARIVEEKGRKTNKQRTAITTSHSATTDVFTISMMKYGSDWIIMTVHTRARQSIPEFPPAVDWSRRIESTSTLMHLLFSFFLLLLLFQLFFPPRQSLNSNNIIFSYSRSERNSTVLSKG